MKTPLPRTPPGRHHQRGRGAQGDRGSVTTEMVVFVVPFLLLLGMFIVFCGRAASAVIDVNSAAAAAARSAANAPTPAAARAAASQAAASTLPDGRWACTTTTNTAAFRRGGSVAVTVSCHIHYTDLGIPGITATRTVNASATQPIDTYRTGP